MSIETLTLYKNRRFKNPKPAAPANFSFSALIAIRCDRALALFDCLRHLQNAELQLELRESWMLRAKDGFGISCAGAALEFQCRAWRYLAGDWANDFLKRVVMCWTDRKPLPAAICLRGSEVPDTKARTRSMRARRMAAWMLKVSAFLNLDSRVDLEVPSAWPTSETLIPFIAFAAMNAIAPATR